MVDSTQDLTSLMRQHTVGSCLAASRLATALGEPATRVAQAT